MPSVNNEANNAEKEISATPVPPGNGMYLVASSIIINLLKISNTVVIVAALLKAQYIIRGITAFNTTIKPDETSETINSQKLLT